MTTTPSSSMSHSPVVAPQKWPPPHPAPLARRLGLIALAVLVLVSAAGFVLTVVASYFENGLAAVPLSEVGGGSYSFAVLRFPPSPLVGVVGGLSGILVPLASGLGAIAVGLDLIVQGPPRPRADRVLGLVVLILCTVVFLAYLPVAQLWVWWMD